MANWTVLATNGNGQNKNLKNGFEKLDIILKTVVDGL